LKVSGRQAITFVAFAISALVTFLHNDISYAGQAHSFPNKAAVKQARHEVTLGGNRRRAQRAASKELRKLLANPPSTQGRSRIGELEWQTKLERWKNRIEQLGYTPAAGGYQEFRGTLINEDYVGQLLLHPRIPVGTTAEVIQLLGRPNEGAEAVLSDSVTPDRSSMTTRYTAITKVASNRTETRAGDSATESHAIPSLESATFGLFYKLTSPQADPTPEASERGRN
jgi:hypothetical protein